MSNGRKLIAIAILVFGALALLLILNKARSTVLISEAQAIHINGKMYAVYLNMENAGEPDVILDVSSKGARRAFVAGVANGRQVAVPKGSAPSFSSDGAHIMVDMRHSKLKAGEFIPLTLSFRNAGAVQVKAVVKDSMTSKSVSMGNPDSKMDHSMHGQVIGATMDIRSGDDAPKIDMFATDNSDGGLILDIKTENFEFHEPMTEPPVHNIGQGHGHLYLNGLKLQRVYSSQATVGALPPGKHIISVTLNTNDHKAYSVDGELVSASFELENR